MYGFETFLSKSVLLHMETISKDKIKHDILRVYHKLNAVPGRNSYAIHGIFSRQIVAKYFGSWQNAIIEIFGLVKDIEYKKLSVNQCLRCGADTKTKFCGSSCAAIYNNTHKTKGYRRSKLEIYLEEQLIKLYSGLEIHFNRKDTINSELDIYIPSLSLAFELNGLFHYEPIFGPEKLSKIQNNDQRKFQACLEKGIELVIIDSSQLEYFKIQSAQKYLDIITQIIDSKLK